MLSAYYKSVTNMYKEEIYYKLMKVVNRLFVYPHLDSELLPNRRHSKSLFILPQHAFFTIRPNLTKLFLSIIINFDFRTRNQSLSGKTHKVEFLVSFQVSEKSYTDISYYPNIRQSPLLSTYINRKVFSYLALVLLGILSLIQHSCSKAVVGYYL